jgi:hypothetical protein
MDSPAVGATRSGSREIAVERLIAYLNSPTVQRILTSFFLLVLGGVAGWLGGRLRRYRLQRQVEQGDAREVVTIEKMLIERLADGREVARIRSCGRDPVDVIFPNPAARDAFHQRALATTPAKPLISMEGKLGSYLLQELAIWVCGQLGEHGHPHDVWVMAAACEAASIGGHRSTTVILIRRSDLARFRDWHDCKPMHVEHGGHGERLLTLMVMADEFDRQDTTVQRRRAEGRRTEFEETMYVLDLGLDIRTIDLPTKPVPWGRFEATLKELRIE